MKNDKILEETKDGFKLNLEWIKENAEKVVGCPVYLSHFEWVKSFSKARNYCFSQVKEDYVLWADLDDALSNKEGFIQYAKINNVNYISI
jgi:glycosyltransferase involved in cell wall biosynthesis